MKTSTMIKCGTSGLLGKTSIISRKSPLENGWFSLLGTLALNKNYHSVSLSKHLQLSANRKLTKIQDYQVLDPDEPHRPLTLLYSWTLAKDKNVMKYAKLHLDNDIDVLKIRTLPLDLLQPTTGARLIAEETMKFIEANPSFNPIIMHGLSVGFYSFGELVSKIASNEKYLDVKNRFVGQILDSPVDVQGLPPGLSRALTNNKALQVSLENLFKIHLKLNYNNATNCYYESSNAIHENLIGTPGLFIYSKGDHVSTPAMNRDIYKTWDPKGMAVYARCFEKSRHCCHLMEEREEYIDLVNRFLERTGVIQPSHSRISATAN